MKKRIVTIYLLLAFCLGLCACGAKDIDNLETSPALTPREKNIPSLKEIELKAASIGQSYLDGDFWWHHNEKIADMTTDEAVEELNYLINYLDEYYDATSKDTNEIAYWLKDYIESMKDTIQTMNDSPHYFESYGGGTTTVFINPNQIEVCKENLNKKIERLQFGYFSEHGGYGCCDYETLLDFN